jgi:ABC-type polysaccharide/polyol phosphate transport system ATPase subunit
MPIKQLKILILLEPPAPTKKSKRANNEEETALAETKSSICLNDLNLTIEKREKIGICGPVGSGKTALLNSILGAVRTFKQTFKPIVLDHPGQRNNFGCGHCCLRQSTSLHH